MTQQTGIALKGPIVSWLAVAHVDITPALLADVRHESVLLMLAKPLYAASVQLLEATSNNDLSGKLEALRVMREIVTQVQTAEPVVESRPAETIRPPRDEQEELQQLRGSLMSIERAFDALLAGIHDAEQAEGKAVKYSSLLDTLHEAITRIKNPPGEAGGA